MSTLQEPQVSGASASDKHNDATGSHSPGRDTKAWGTLAILSGSQQGAAASLPTRVNVSIGRSLDNDIVLRDPSVDAVHAALMAVDDSVLLQCLGPSLLVDGLEMYSGESRTISGACTIQLGDVALSIENYSGKTSSGLAGAEAAQVQSTYFMPKVDDLPVPQGSDAKPDSDAENTHHDLAQGGSSSSRKYGLMTTTVVLLGAFFVWQSGLFSPQQADPVSLQGLLAASPFAALSVQQVGNRATVGGFLETTQQSVQLEQWLEQSGLEISNDVVVGETLGDKVFDVFRVHGIPADVQVDDGGNVVVATRESDSSLLDAVDERVRSDVPGVASLSIDNTPPLIEETPGPVKTDPGKRVAMVISDDPAHIVTEDRSRYFVGSLLPTGHRIESIDDGVVSLLKNGISTKLEF